MSWITCAVVLLGAGIEPSNSGAGTGIESPISGTSTHAISDSFIVTSHHPSHDARTIARLCERSRRQLQSWWCEGKTESWSPACHIVVHDSQSSYLAAVGAGAARTSGSSWVEFDKNKLVSRRQLDFRGDTKEGLAAVPHELTHIVLADMLGGRQPPRWADEGMAILADPFHKRQLHERDLGEGLSRRLSFRAIELLTLESYPHPSRVPAFYGQSASVTSFLVSRDSPGTFVAFVRDSLDRGYDAALRRQYDIAGVAELERLWWLGRTNVASP
jgi:hypothetical protein